MFPREWRIFRGVRGGFFYRRKGGTTTLLLVRATESSKSTQAINNHETFRASEVKQRQFECFHDE
jgi:hypothetical protein